MIDLSPTHFHLLLNHVPTIGFAVGLGLFVIALVVRSDHLKQASLVVITGIALLTIPAYATGAAAQETLREAPGVSVRLIEMHEELAFIALLLMQITGGFAWLGLWHYRRVQHLPRWNAAVLVALSFITFTIVARAASIGGEIRHPEIRVTQDVERIPLVRQFATWVSETPPVWVIAETLHFIGLSLVIGIMLLINLRMLGIIKNVPFGALERLLPWAVLGFGLNVFTGMVFFVTMPGQYISSDPFYWKLLFLMLAGASTVYFLYDRGWTTPAGSDTPALSKLLAASTLTMWFLVLFWGNMLPFLGDAF